MTNLHRVYSSWEPSPRRKGATSGKGIPLRRASSQKRKTRAVRVAVWDLGAWVSYLDDILGQWNARQGEFEFQVVYLSVPPQLVMGNERTLEAAKEYLRGRSLSSNVEDIRNNLFVNDLLPIAKRVRDDLGYDLLVLIAPLMVAF